MRRESISPAISDVERAIIALAVETRCNISAAMERRIRGAERARVVDRLRRLEIFAISREPSRRRLRAQRFAAAEALEGAVRRDEKQLIIRELRREARIGGAAGLDGDALELAAVQLEAGAI
jgi:hypothetical protein